jgi:hypothetical protein
MPGFVDEQHTDMIYATPEYFRTLRIPLLAGRVFTENDTAASSPVAVANEAFVNRYLRGQQPVGQVVGRSLHVIGVVGNIQARRAGWAISAPSHTFQRSLSRRLNSTIRLPNYFILLHHLILSYAVRFQDVRRSPP